MKLTNEEVLLKFLSERVKRNQFNIASHEIEMDFLQYARVVWGVTLIPSTAGRLWRKIREKQLYKKIGIEDVKRLKTDSKAGHWHLATS